MPRGKPISSDLRGRILQYHEEGATLSEIARTLLLSTSTVQYVIRRKKRTGNIAAGKSTGRPLRLSARDLRSLRRFMILNRYANVFNLMQWCETVLGKQISKATMYRYVRRLRFRFYKAKKKPFVPAVNKRRRLAWARAHKS